MPISKKTRNKYKKRTGSAERRSEGRGSEGQTRWQCTALSQVTGGQMRCWRTVEGAY